MTGGPERRDESVQFSLKELMKLEDERVGEERRARDAREAAEARAREEAARREREELAARERAEAEDRERARLRVVEEEARREAMSRAAVEQARIAVEARARAEEADRERRHELELVRARTESQKKPAVGGFVGSALGGAGLVLLGAVVVHFAVVKPASDRRLEEATRGGAIAEARADELARRADELAGRANEQAKQIAQLEARAAQDKSEIDRLKSFGPRTTPPKVGGGKGPIEKSSKLPDEKPCLDEHDPLCGTIRRHP